MEIKRNILLNPGPSTTTNSVKLAQVVPDICPREREFADIMAPLRDDLCRIVHGRTDDYTAVLFCGSGTICIDIALNSLLDEGKRALVINNGSYSDRACECLRAYGLPFIELMQPYDRLPDLSAIEDVLRENKDIGYVYMTHHETGSGLLNPIRSVGELAHRYGAFFITDTTSSYAMIPINVYEDNVDFLMASAQKGIMGMTGLSFIIGRRSLIEASKSFPVRSFYCNLYRQYEYFERTGEMQFTPPVQTIYAARQALKEYFAEGEAAKWERHQRIMAAIHEGEDRLGLKEALDRSVQSGLVSAVLYPNDKNWDFEKIHDYCYERGFTIYPGKLQKQGTFRLCALGAIDEDDIKRFWSVFKEALEKYGIAFPDAVQKADEEDENSRGGRKEKLCAENTEINGEDRQPREKLAMPEYRRKRLRQLLKTRPIVKTIEAHNGLTGLIAEKTVVDDNGSPAQFDAMWISSLCDSTAKGKPDIELVDMSSRLRSIDDIMEVTTKPIILDGDTGGLAEHFVYNVRTLERMGVSAVIIEDKKGLKKNSLFGTEVEQTQDDTASFCRKISAGCAARLTNDFMIIARIESLILEKGMDDALYRASEYVKAGADGIMIHSRKKDPEEIFEFCDRFRAADKNTPLVVVPTSFNSVMEEELIAHGVNIVIYANQLMRSAFPAMQKTAESILKNHRALEADPMLMPFKEIINLIEEI